MQSKKKSNGRKPPPVDDGFSKKPIDFKNNKDQSWRIFEKISSKYDITNRVLSFGMDTGWRKKILHFLPDKKNLTHLDIATGTGDVIITLRKNSRLISKSIGVDKSPKIMAIAKKKVEAYPFSKSTFFLDGDGEKFTHRNRVDRYSHLVIWDSQFFFHSKILKRNKKGIEKGW